LLAAVKPRPVSRIVDDSCTLVERPRLAEVGLNADSIGCAAEIDSRGTAIDPLRSHEHLDSGQSVERRDFELEHLKAAVGELTQSARSGQSTSGPESPTIGAG